jgi:hypothetical protein
VVNGVDRATVTRAVHQIRPLLARLASPSPMPGVRLHTLADVFAYAAAHEVQLRIDDIETQVRRPRPTRRCGGRSSPARRTRTPSRPPEPAAIMLQWVPPGIELVSSSSCTARGP